MIYAALGHDRITGLGGIARALPVSVLAFALAGVALLGMPPSGAYLAKELLLQAAVETQQWWWAVAIQAGGIFTAGYVLLVLAHALAPADEPVTLRFRGSRTLEGVALALALCSLLLGIFPWQAYLPVAPGTGATPSVLAALASTLWLVLGGAALAVLVGHWNDRIARVSFGRIVAATIGPARTAALALAGMLARVDDMLRQWLAAGLALLVLAILLGAAMLAAP